MSDEVKNFYEILLTLLGITVAFVGYREGLKQWRLSQLWQRSEKLDEFIQQFESDPLLSMASQVIDYSERRLKMGELNFVFRRSDALMALRIHSPTSAIVFTQEQALIRDAYDRLLSFFVRLETAISTGLVDARPAAQFFKYWVERFVTMEEHSRPDDPMPAEDLAWRYIGKYGDEKSMRRLCKKFGCSVTRDADEVESSKKSGAEI